MLHLELGLNPLATARLKNHDLKFYGSDEAGYFQLQVPRVKKRTARRETKSRPISNKLGELLTKNKIGDEKGALLHWLERSHPQGSIIRAMRRFADDAKLISPRTNECLHLNPRRFRYTLATQMAAEGAPAYLIAEILDHSDLQNVEVYIETASTITDHVERATDQALKPLVNRFLGRIATVEEENGKTELPVIPGDVPLLPLLNAGGVGLCGRGISKNKLCDLNPPLSCYGCVSFVPFRSGPHQQMLDSINSFLARIGESSDQRITMQLDDVRIAIQEVFVKIDNTRSQ